MNRLLKSTYVFTMTLACLSNVSFAKGQVFKNSKGYEITLPSCWGVEVDGPNDGTEPVESEDILLFSPKKCNLPLQKLNRGISVGIYPEKLNRRLAEENFKKRIEFYKNSKKFIYFSDLPSNYYMTYTVEQFSSDEKKPRFRWQIVQYCKKNKIEIEGTFHSDEAQTDEDVLKKINKKNFDLPSETLSILKTIKCVP